MYWLNCHQTKHFPSTRNTDNTVPEDDDDDDGHGSGSGSDLEVDPKDVEDAKKLTAQQQIMKRAGIPELKLDALPSSIAPKLMNLYLKDLFWEPNPAMMPPIERSVL